MASRSETIYGSMDVRSESPATSGRRSTSAAPLAGPVAALKRVVDEAAADASPARVLALTHRSPDPDALGALVGMRTLIQALCGHEVQIATVGRIHRAENLAMVRELGLVFDDYSDLDPARFCGSVLVDTQPTFGHTVVPEGIPLLAVFDHHRAPDEAPIEGPRVTVPHVDVREDLGATSSLVYEYLRDAHVEIDERTATALFCGVRYDTGDLSYNVSPLDEEAWFETFRRADRRRVARIARPALPVEYYRELNRALSLARRYGNLVLCLMGEVLNPESVAEMADFYLRMDECRWSLVGGLYEGTYYVSLRTQFGGGYAYPLLERVLDGEGSFGGHGRVAGGRIPCDAAGTELERQENRLRKRALDILADVSRLDGESRVGKPLT